MSRFKFKYIRLVQFNISKSVLIFLIYIQGLGSYIDITTFDEYQIVCCIKAGDLIKYDKMDLKFNFKMLSYLRILNGLKFIIFNGDETVFRNMKYSGRKIIFIYDINGITAKQALFDTFVVLVDYSDHEIFKNETRFSIIFVQVIKLIKALIITWWKKKMKK